MLWKKIISTRQLNVPFDLLCQLRESIKGLTAIDIVNFC